MLHLVGRHVCRDGPLYGRMGMITLLMLSCSATTRRAICRGHMGTLAVACMSTQTACDTLRKLLTQQHCFGEKVQESALA